MGANLSKQDDIRVLSLFGMNGFWHLSAAYYFIFKARGIMKIMTHYQFRKGNELETEYMVDMFRFLGLLNTAFVALAMICLYRYYKCKSKQDKGDDKRWEYMLLFGIANMSQFIGDMKLIRDGGKIKPYFLYTITAGDGFFGFIDLYIAVLLHRSIKK